MSPHRCHLFSSAYKLQGQFILLIALVVWNLVFEVLSRRNWTQYNVLHRVRARHSPFFFLPLSIFHCTINNCWCTDVWFCCRKKLASRMFGNSIIGVGIASSLYHSSRGDLRKYFRFCDYAMIATSTVVRNSLHLALCIYIRFMRRNDKPWKVAQKMVTASLILYSNINKMQSTLLLNGL